jgi:hypothetical protein
MRGRVRREELEARAVRRLGTAARREVGDGASFSGEARLASSEASILTIHDARRSSIRRSQTAQKAICRRARHTRLVT